jgi:hypothetical protein
MFGSYKRYYAQYALNVKELSYILLVSSHKCLGPQGCLLLGVPVTIL